MLQLKVPAITNIYKIDQNKILGKGAYAKVYYATHRTTRQPVAIKVFRKLTAHDIVNIRAEVNALQKVAHPNIVGCIDAVQTEVLFCVILEYIEDGHSLVDLFMDKRANEKSMSHVRVTEKDVQHIIRQLVNALYYAMCKKVCHRDVKLDNVLVRDFNTFDVVLADFNFSKELDTTKAIMRTRLGTPGFMAPEIIAGVAYNYKCDIWSVGVMFYELLSWGLPPFLEHARTNTIDGYTETFKALPKLTLHFLPEEQFEHVSEEAKQLLKGILVCKPKYRIPYKKIKRHIWFVDDNVPNEVFNLNYTTREE